MAKSEHRWIDTTGGPVDDDDWLLTRTTPTFGDGQPASLAQGEVRRLSPRVDRLVVSFEAFDGIGVADPPTTPTPVVTATLQMVTVGKDQAGNETFEAGPALTASVNQQRLIETELGKQGTSFVRVTAITGAPDPGSIRVYVHEDVQ